MSIYVSSPPQKAVGCVIWMHGLGADATDMQGLVEALPISIPLRHVFLDAPVRPVTLNNRMPMRAWYDIIGINLTDREDKVGIEESATWIREVLLQQQADGFALNTIFLAGFSQGGAMALYTGLSLSSALAGIVVLSGYLPSVSSARADLPRDTPIFVASGDHDAIVLPAWTGITVDYLKKKGYHNLACHRYPMEHAICAEEVRDIGQWISNTLVSKEIL